VKRKMHKTTTAQQHLPTVVVLHKWDKDGGMSLWSSDS